MRMTTVREKADTTKISITTSAAGLAGIPAEEYGIARGMRGAS